MKIVFECLYFCCSVECRVCAIAGASFASRTQTDVRRYRNVMFKRLCDGIKSIECAAQNCRDKSLKQHRVLCNNCQLWFHFQCEKLAQKPCGAFYCRCSSHFMWWLCGVHTIWCIPRIQDMASNFCYRQYHLSLCFTYYNHYNVFLSSEVHIDVEKLSLAVVETI